MQRFATSREAKEFLISKIIDQAQRDGIALSDIEQKILYWSETDWTLPEIDEVNTAFERDYDQKRYERKSFRSFGGYDPGNAERTPPILLFARRPLKTSAKVTTIRWE